MLENYEDWYTLSARIFIYFQEKKKKKKTKKMEVVQPNQGFESYEIQSDMLKTRLYDASQTNTECNQNIPNGMWQLFTNVYYTILTLVM